jgi:hypothetical protein
MDVTLDTEESEAIQAALQAYLSDLRVQISDADNSRFKAELRQHREVLERALSKLDAAAHGSGQRGPDGEVAIRLVSYWRTTT